MRKRRISILAFVLLTFITQLCYSRKKDLEEEKNFTYNIMPRLKWKHVEFDVEFTA